MNEVQGRMRIIGFADAASFEPWLGEQQSGAAGLWIKLVKRGPGVASLSKVEAIDAFRCYGWIDGLLDTISGHVQRQVRGHGLQCGQIALHPFDVGEELFV